MGRGKQDAAGQALRRQQLIDYIKEHGPVKSGDICAALSLSRSSLSDDINAINAQAPILTSPKRGYYCYDPDAEKYLTDGALRGKLDQAHIRQWFILALLSAQACSFETILDELEEESFSCGLATVHADLKSLKDSKYITTVQKDGHTLYTSSVLHAADRKELTQFYAQQKAAQSGSRILVSAYDTINKKLSHCIPDNTLKIKQTTARRVGKHSVISSGQLDLLQAFQQYPYSENVLTIPYRANTGRLVTRSFSTGLILYSAETNRIYLIGKDGDKRNTIIALDRILMDQILVQDDCYNYVYQTPEFLQMYEEMFHLSTDDPVTVRVRFTNLPFITAKVQRLSEVRKKSSVELISDGKEILYTDTLRGISDFSRYLRRFGRAALVDEPEELKDMMLYTSKRVIELYEESF